MMGLFDVFRTTTNTLGENGDKKQNALPYTLQVKVVEVCLVGAMIRARHRHTSTGIKNHILTQKTPKNRRFYVIFYSYCKHL